MTLTNTKSSMKWTEEARGAAHPEDSLLWGADFVEIGWLYISALRNSCCGKTEQEPVLQKYQLRPPD